MIRRRQSVKRTHVRRVLLAVVATQATLTVAGDLDPTGRMAIDRMVSAAANAVDPAGKLAGDLYVDYKSARQKIPEISGAVIAAVSRYNISLANNGLQLNIYKGASLVRDTALAAGGPVGIAAAGAFRASIDRIVEDIYEKRNTADMTILQRAIRSFNEDELKALRSEGENGQQSSRFHDAVGSVIDATGKVDPKGKEAIQQELLRLTLSMSEEQIRNISQLSKQQAIANDQLSSSVSQIDKLNKQTQDLQEKMTSVESASHQTVIMLDRVKYDQLTTDQARAEYLRQGGLAHLDSSKRDELLRTVQTRAKYEAVHEALGNTANGLNSLSLFVGNVLHDKNAEAAIGQVATGVQAVQAAVTVLALFSGVGTPMAALGAVGSLSTMFGGGDPVGGVGPQLQAIEATLSEMNKKLDRILQLQEATLQSLAQIERKIDKLQEDVHGLTNSTNEGIGLVLAAQWKGVYSGCRGLLEGFQGGGGGSFDFPYRQSSSYTEAHFLDSERFELLNSQDGRDCWDGLISLARQPSDVPKLAYRNQATKEKRIGVEAAEKQYADARSLLSWFVSQRAANDENANEIYLAAMLTMSRPATRIDEIRVRARTFNGSISDDSRTCWWRVTQDESKCKWAAQQLGNNGFNEYTFLLVGEPLIHPWAIAELDDYTLSFYEQPIVPRGKSVQDKLGQIQASAVAQAAQKAFLKQQKGIVELLTRYLQITDAAVAQQALMDGDLLAGFIAEELLNPTVSRRVQPKPFAIAPINDIPEECISKWGEQPSGIAAPLNAYLRDHPRTAVLALQLIAHRAALPDSFDFSRAMRYELSRTSEPTGRDLSAARGTAIPLEMSKIDQEWIDWWAGLLDLGYADFNGHKYVHRGFQIHYASVDGEKAKIWAARLKNSNDDADNVCGGYALDAGIVELPRGWSLSVGGTVMSLPPVASLRIGLITPSSGLEALIDRQASLTQELASVAIDPSISGIELPISYALAQQARTFAHRRNAVKFGPNVLGEKE